MLAAKTSGQVGDPNASPQLINIPTGFAADGDAIAGSPEIPAESSGNRYVVLVVGFVILVTVPLFARRLKSSNNSGLPFLHQRPETGWPKTYLVE